MNKESEQLDALQDIRKMMKESSRFLSLSGLSGILAGLYALGGAAVAYVLIREFAVQDHLRSEAFDQLVLKISMICGMVLLLSLATAFYLTGRKARKSGHRLFDHASKKVLWSMAVPLISGGIVCLALLRGPAYVFLIPSAMLIFYGLGLIAASRHTLDEVRYLGYLELSLGLVSCFIPEHGPIYWVVGFGFLHIVYGSIMWYRYDRKS